MSVGAEEWVAPVFPADEVPFILSGIYRCGAQLRKVHATEKENDLSDRLRDFLDQDPVIRSRPIELFREIPLYDRRTARKKPLGRSDIMFLASTGTRKPWPYFVTEAKRLHVTFPSGWDSLVPEYVTGSQGMMCFVDQRYARDLACAGMLGYVFDGNIDAACDAVGNCIALNATKLKSSGQKKLVSSALLPGDPRLRESTHEFPRAFTLYHQFLAV
jgi:hypothetical protein